MATKTEELPDSGDHDTAPDSSSAEQQPAVDPEIGNPARQEAEALLESLRPVGPGGAGKSRVLGLEQ